MRHLQAPPSTLLAFGASQATLGRGPEACPKIKRSALTQEFGPPPHAMLHGQGSAEPFGTLGDRARVGIQLSNTRTRMGESRYLVIVARREPDLCEYLRRALSGDRKVEVLLDRRHEERRQRGGPHEPERRRAQRRRQSPRSDWFVEIQRPTD